ncbi:expressed unknown protein (Partial), partial [Seminavis robusta]
RMRQLRVDNTTLKDQYRALQDDYRTAQHEIRKLQLQNDNSNKTPDQTKAMEKLRDKNMELEVENRAMTHSLKRVNDQVAALETKCTKLEDRNRNVEAQLAATKRRASVSGGDVAQLAALLQTENQQLRTAKEALEKQMQQQPKSSTKSASAQQPDSETKLAKLQSVLDATKKQLQHAQQKWADADIHHQHQIQTLTRDKNQQLQDLTLKLDAAVREAQDRAQRDFMASQSTQSMLQEQLEEERQQHASQQQTEIVKAVRANTDQLEAEHERKLQEQVDRQQAESAKELATAQARYEVQLAALEAKQGGLEEIYQKEMSELEAKHEKLLMEKGGQLAEEHSKVKRLEQRLGDQEGELDRLKKRVEDLGTEKKRLKAELASSQHLAATTDHQLQEALETLGELETKLQVVGLFKKAREDAKGNDKGQTSRGLASPSSVADDPAEPLPDIDAIMLKQLAKAKTANAKTHGELQTVIEYNISELKDIHESMQGGITQANCEIKALETGMDDLKKLQREVAQLDAANKSANRQKKSLERKLADSQDKLDTASNVVKRLAGDNENLQRELVGAQLDRDDSQEKLEKVTSDLEQARDDLKVARDESEKALQAMDDTASKLREAIGKCRELEGIVEQQKHTIAQLETNALEAQREKARLEAKIDDGQQRHRSMESANDRTGEALNAVNDALKKSQREVDKQRKEISRLEEDLTTANDEVEELRKAAKEHTKQNAQDVQNLRNERSSLKAAKDEALAELEETKHQASKLQSAVDRDRKKVSRLEEELSEARDDIEDLAKRNDTLKKKHEKDLGDLKSERGYLRAEIEKLKRENSNMEASKAESMELIDEYGPKLKELEETRKRLEAQTEFWAAREAELTNVIAELQDSAAETEREVRQSYETLKSEVAASQEAKENALKTQSKISKELQDAQQETKALSDRNQDLKRQQMNKDQELEKLQWELDAKTKENESLKTKTARLEALVGETNNELETVRGELGKLKKDMRSEVSRLEDLEREAKRQLDAARSDLGAKKKEVDLLKSEMSELEASQNNTKRGLTKIKQKLEEKEDENDALKDEVDSLKAQIRREEKLQAQLAQQPRAVSREIDSLAMATSRDLPKHVDDKRDEEIRNLQKSLNERRLALENLEDRYQDLSKTHQGLVKASRDAAVALSQQLDERTTELNDLGKKSRKALKENVTLKERLRVAEEQKLKDTSALEQSNRELQAALADINALRPVQERASLELEEVGAIRDAAQESLKKAEARVDSMRDLHEKESRAKNEKIEQLAKDLLEAERTARGHERQFEEAKYKLRQAALDTQKLHKDHTAEVNALNARLSELQESLDGAKKEHSELETIKNDVDSQLKRSETQVESLREKLASHKKEFEGRDRARQIAYQNLVNRAKKLEKDLPEVIKERDVVDKQLEQIRRELADALSNKSDLQAALKKAESDLAAVARALAEEIQKVSKTGANELKHGGPMDLVEKVKAALRNAIDGREDAIRSRKAYEDAFDESKALARSLGGIIEKKDQRLAELQNTFDQEKAMLMAELNNLDAVVQQIAAENNKLAKLLESEQRKAENEGRLFNSHLKNARRDRELLSGQNNSLKKSLNDAATAAAKLKDKAENQSRVDDDYKSLQKMNQSLQKSLERATSVIKEMNNPQRDLSKVADDRTSTLEAALDEKESRLHEALRQLQEADEDNEALHAEAVKLKWFLDEFLSEAKQLVEILSDNVNENEPESARPNSRTRSVLARLESIVKHMETGVGSHLQQHKEHVQSRPHKQHRTRSPVLPSANPADAEKETLGTEEGTVLYDDNDEAGNSHQSANPASDGEGSQISSDNSNGSRKTPSPVAARELDQAAYVRERLAKSAAALVPRAPSSAAWRTKEWLLKSGTNPRMLHNTAPDAHQRGTKLDAPHAYYKGPKASFVPSRGSTADRPRSFVTGITHPRGIGAKSPGNSVHQEDVDTGVSVGGTEPHGEDTSSKLDRARWGARQ